MATGGCRHRLVVRADAPELHPVGTGVGDRRNRSGTGKRQASAIEGVATAAHSDHRGRRGRVVCNRCGNSSSAPGPETCRRCSQQVWGEENRYGLAPGATRLLASIVARPPAWWRPSYDLGGTDLRHGCCSFGGAFAVLAVLAVAAVWCVQASARSGFRGAKPMLLVGAVASAAGLLTPSARATSTLRRERPQVPLPLATGSLLRRHVCFRALGAARASTLRPGGRLLRWTAPASLATAVVVVFAGVIACLTVPTRTRSEGEFTFRDIWPVAAELRSHLVTIGTSREPCWSKLRRVAVIDYFTWADRRLSSNVRGSSSSSTPRPRAHQVGNATTRRWQRRGAALPGHR